MQVARLILYFEDYFHKERIICFSCVYNPSSIILYQILFLSLICETFQCLLIGIKANGRISNARLDPHSELFVR